MSKKPLEGAKDKVERSMLSSMGLVFALVAVVVSFVLMSIQGLGHGECELQDIPPSIDRVMLPDYPLKCGLQELKTVNPNRVRVFAYIQKGLWCWSNAGIVLDVQKNEVTFVDVLTDLKQTRRFLDAVKHVVGPNAKYKNLIYTHCDIDHFAGQELLYDQVEKVYARPGCDVAMKAFYNSKVNFGTIFKKLHYVWNLSGLRPVVKTMQSLGWKENIPKWMSKISVVQYFDYFDFDKIDYTTVRLPDNHVVERMSITLGDSESDTVEVIPVGVDSHSDHDLIVAIPSANVIFTGDILFHGMTPVNWAGTFETAIQACQEVLSYSSFTSTITYVPGHGALTNKGAFSKSIKYWKSLQTQVQGCEERNVSALECAYHVLETVPQNQRQPDYERTLINILVHYANKFGTDKVNKLGFITEYAHAKLIS